MPGGGLARIRGGTINSGQSEGGSSGNLRTKGRRLSDFLFLF